MWVLRTLGAPTELRDVHMQLYAKAATPSAQDALRDPSTAVVVLAVVPVAGVRQALRRTAQASQACHGHIS